MLLTDFLTEIGAFDTKHSGRTLGDHLLGTYELLREFGCPEHVCLAGGIHSVYGTAAFKTQTIGFADREKVAAIFGADAERLAYLFCVASRPKGLEQSDLFDHRTGEPLDVLSEELLALRLIEAANLIEQDSGLDHLPVIQRTLEKHLELAEAA